MSVSINIMGLIIARVSHMLGLQTENIIQKQNFVKI